MKRLFILILLLFTISYATEGQSRFIRFIQNQSNLSAALRVLFEKQDCIYLVGVGDSVQILRLDSLGNTINQKKLYSFRYHDFFDASDSSFILFGIERFPPGDSTLLSILKMDTALNIISHQSYKFPYWIVGINAFEADSNSYYVILNCNFVVIGGLTETRAVLFKGDTNGNIIWSKEIICADTSVTSAITHLDITPNSDLLLCGTVFEKNFGHGANIFAMKLDSSGNIINYNMLNAPYLYSKAIVYVNDSTTLLLSNASGNYMFSFTLDSTLKYKSGFRYFGKYINDYYPSVIDLNDSLIVVGGSSSLSLFNKNGEKSNTIGYAPGGGTVGLISNVFKNDNYILFAFIHSFTQYLIKADLNLYTSCQNTISPQQTPTSITVPDTVSTFSAVPLPYVNDTTSLTISQGTLKNSLYCADPLNTIELDDEYQSFLIYPNPAKGSIEIIYQLPQNKSGMFELYDVSGKKVFTYTLPPWSTKQDFDLSFLSNGMYHAVITSDGFTKAEKLVLLRP